MKNNNSLLALSIVLIFIGLVCFSITSLTSCSKSTFVRILTPNIELEYNKPDNYKIYNKYQKDALYLVELIEQSYPRLESKLPNFDEIGNTFINQMATVDNDYTFKIELKKFMAQLKDGHSYSSVDFKTEEKFNVKLFKYDNEGEWLIKNIETTIDSSLIGSQLISINEKDIATVKDLLSQFESGENIYNKIRSFWHWIKNPKYLEAAGIIAKGDKLRLELSKNGNRSSIVLDREKAEDFYVINRSERKYPFAKYQNNGFYTHIDSTNDFAYLQMNTCLDYVAINSEIDNYTNKLTKPFAMSYLKKEKKEAMDFGVVLQKLFSQIEKDSIQDLIVDLRYNSGGDERLGKQLIWYLTERTDINGFTEYGHNSKFYRQSMDKDYKEENEIYIQKYGETLPEGEYNVSTDIYNETYFHDIEKVGSPFLLDNSISKFKGNVYVLIGGYTFSAASVLATTMYDNNLATFVGKPTGNKPSCQTGYSSVKLPQTKELVHLSIMYMERPNKEKNDEIALFPHIEINPSFEKSYLSNIDESIDAILNMITISEQKLINEIQ